MDKSVRKVYLGDGVYALWDGFQIELRANDLQSPTDTIFLEGSVMEALISFWERVSDDGVDYEPDN